ncbi:hypothetical protein QLQ15_04945 [Lysobacter sp. LF1]|uniref:Uncharacterized protein n=1 Tax=Lysobacter stagni TaxID=3045172 RepID=A0ABT6XDN8_9GAMM|nr:hypothetical protein [Lysobacter sp. LF1]MDI9238257.1 hypothetical protein [Lysobacter sp. LF1]
MQVFFIPRARPPVPRMPNVAARRAAPEAEIGAAQAELPRNAPAPTAASTSTEVYSPDGRIRLPANIAIDPLKPEALPPGASDGDAPASASRIFERRNPIDYRPTRFDKDWASDGTLGDVALQKLGNRLEGFAALSRFVFGKDHSARARPPPDVPFNPALHERPSDLGSEATGDAYKAAPIKFEHAPDLKGEASRRIRASADELLKRHTDCDPLLLKRLLAPVQANIVELEHIERAMAHGVDPTQAEHLMPRSADRAYDLARRALWYADKQLKGCRPSSGN